MQSKINKNNKQHYKGGARAARGGAQCARLYRTEKTHSGVGLGVFGQIVANSAEQKAELNLQTHFNLILKLNWGPEKATQRHTIASIAATGQVVLV